MATTGHINRYNFGEVNCKILIKHYKKLTSRCMTRHHKHHSINNLLSLLKCVCNFFFTHNCLLHVFWYLSYLTVPYLWPILIRTKMWTLKINPIIDNPLKIQHKSSTSAAILITPHLATSQRVHWSHEQHYRELINKLKQNLHFACTLIQTKISKVTTKYSLQNIIISPCRDCTC